MEVVRTPGLITAAEAARRLGVEPRTIRRWIAAGVLTGYRLRRVAASEVDTCWRVPTSRHPLYDTWYGMRRRCLDPRDARYKRYGGRGIGVCGPWLDFASFRDDIEHLLGPRPEGMRLDRIDNDGDYEPGNVQWNTSYEQRDNH